MRSDDQALLDHAAEVIRTLDYGRAASEIAAKALIARLVARLTEATKEPDADTWARDTLNDLRVRIEALEGNSERLRAHRAAIWDRFDSLLHRQDHL